VCGRCRRRCPLQQRRDPGRRHAARLLSAPEVGHGQGCSGLPPARRSGRRAGARRPSGCPARRLGVSWRRTGCGRCGGAGPAGLCSLGQLHGSRLVDLLERRSDAGGGETEPRPAAGTEAHRAELAGMLVHPRARLAVESGDRRRRRAVRSATAPRRSTAWRVVRRVGRLVGRAYRRRSPPVRGRMWRSRRWCWWSSLSRG
jgi:hypothetical protein